MQRRRTEEAVDAAKLIKFVTTIDPYSLTPRAYNPWKDGPNYGTEITAAWKQAGLSPDYSLRTTQKLWQGLSDIAEIVGNALDDYGKPLAEGDAVAIARHDVSVATIAYAAQLGEKALRNTNSRQSSYNSGVVRGDAPMRDTSHWLYNLDNDPTYSRRFIVDDELGALIQNPDFEEYGEFRHPNYGCPFAHGEANRPKVFDNFVRWAGTLAIRTYFENKKDAS